MKKLAITLSVLFIIFILGLEQVAAAKAVESSVDPSWFKILIGKEGVGTLPTSPFYFFKEWGRGIRKFFTFDKLKKAELELRYTDEKILETAKVAQEKCVPELCDQKALERALNNYLESQKRLVERLKTLDEKNPNVEKLVEKTFQRVVQHEALFDELKQSAGGNRSSITINILDRAGATAKETKNELVDTLAKKIVTPSGHVIVRQIKRGNRRTIKPDLPYSDEVKDLKTLEILTRLADELPEDKKETKEVLQNVAVQTALEVLAPEPEKEKPITTDVIKELIQKIKPIDGSGAGGDPDSSWYSIDNVPFKGGALKKVLIQIVEPAPAIQTEKLEPPTTIEEKTKPTLFPLPLPEPEKKELEKLIEEKLKAVLAQPVETEVVTPPQQIIQPPPVKETPLHKIEESKEIEDKEIKQGPSDSQKIKPNSQSTTDQLKEFRIIAKNWFFEPSAITVNKGDRVKLIITSVDVIHGFALPDFGININLEPDKTQTVEFVASKVGTFTFYCSVYCGSGHRDMKGQLIVK